MARTVNYITAAELIGKIPAQDRDAAVDDDADGSADSGVMTQLIEDCCNDVDVFYNLRGIATPVDPAVYPLAKQAALYLATEQFYTRRGEPAERNPNWKMVGMMRELLNKLGNGQLARGGAITSPLDVTPSDNANAGDVVSFESEPALTYGGPRKVLS